MLITEIGVNCALIAQAHIGNSKNINHQIAIPFSTFQMEIGIRIPI